MNRILEKSLVQKQNPSFSKYTRKNLGIGVPILSTVGLAIAQLIDLDRTSTVIFIRDISSENWIGKEDSIFREEEELHEKQQRKIDQRGKTE